MYVPDRTAYGTKAPMMVAFKFIKRKLKILSFKELDHLHNFNSTHMVALLDCGHHVMRRDKPGLLTTICPRCYEIWKKDRYEYDAFLKTKIETFKWEKDPLRKINERHTP